MKTIAIAEVESGGVDYLIEVEIYFELNAYTRAVPEVEDWSIAGVWADGVEVDDWPDADHNAIMSAIREVVYYGFEE